jgi:hypothetical protein
LCEGLSKRWPRILIAAIAQCWWGWLDRQAGRQAGTLAVALSELDWQAGRQAGTLAVALSELDWQAGRQAGGQAGRQRGPSAASGAHLVGDGGQGDALILDVQVLLGLNGLQIIQRLK